MCDKTGAITLFHLSYDPITQFTLRVPQDRIAEEDGTVKRICLAPSIEDCINAKPGRGAPIRAALEQDVPLALFLYWTDIPVSSPNLILPVTLCQKYGVKDAIWNQEHWLTEIPDFQELILLLDDAVIDDTGCEAYPTVRKISAHPIEALPQFCAQTWIGKANEYLHTQFTTGNLLMQLPSFSRRLREPAEN